MGTRKRKVWFNIGLCILFLLLSIVYVWPFAHRGVIFGSGDLMFHVNRMEELYQDIQRGVLVPRISSFSFNQVGSGINFFYPWVLLYPFAIIRLLTHNPISAFYIGIVLINFLTLGIAYYSMLRFASSRKRAFTFAIIYSFANYRLYLVFNQNVLAEALAYTFMPLVLLGFYEIFFRDNHKWPLLALGMTFLIYSHMLTTALMAAFLLVTLIVFWHFIDDKTTRLWSAVKAAVLSLLLSAFYLFPFVEQTLSNNLVASWKGLVLIHTPSETILNSLNNSPYQYIGLVLVITLFLGVFIWHNAEITDRYAYIAGTVLTVLTTTLIPWRKLVNTPLSIMQFPYRLNGLATLLLAIYLSRIIQLWFRRIYGQYWPKVILGILAFIPVGLVYSAEQQLITARENIPYLSKRPTIRHYYPQQNGSSYNLTESEWDNQLHFYAHNGAFDYFPKATGNETTQIALHKAVVNGQTILMSKELTSRPNQLSYDLSGIKAGSKVELPVLYYHNDLVKVGSRKYQKPKVTKHSLIQITVPQHNKNVTVMYKNSVLDIISLWISIITWLGTIIYYCRDEIRRLK